MDDMQALQFVSNVVEIKPNKKYLLVFKGDIPMGKLNDLIERLRESCIQGFGIALSDGQDLQIVEVPASHTGE